MKIQKLKLNNEIITIKLVDNSKITILEACLSMGVYIPHFCYNKNLLIAGNCRICIVEVEKIVKPIISCLNLCIDNLSIYTNSFSLKKFRENVLEFLLINHPLDCPICDQAGECDLQEQTLYYGLDKSRFFFKKKTNSDLYLNNFIKIILNRCILCVRCIRYLREVNINYEYSNLLGTLGRGSFSKIHLYNPLVELSSGASSNIIDICPVGALTFKYQQYIARPWEYNSIISFDFNDSFGLPIQLDFKMEKLIRVLPVLDSVFYLDFISDFTRLSVDMYSSLFKLLYNLNIQNLKFNIFKVLNLKTFINFYLPLNSLYSFNILKLNFKNLVSNNKLFISSVNFVSNFNNKYLLSFNINNNFKILSFLYINSILKYNMFRFFVYLNEINKIYNNIFYIESEDFNILNIFDLNIKKNMLMFINSLSFKNISKKKKYLIQYLNFFKVVLNFDEIFGFIFEKVNMIFSEIKNLILINYKYIEFKNIIDKNINLYSIKFIDYDLINIYNILGKNMNSNNSLINFIHKVYMDNFFKFYIVNVV